MTPSPQAHLYVTGNINDYVSAALLSSSPRNGRSTRAQVPTSPAASSSRNNVRVRAIYLETTSWWVMNFYQSFIPCQHAARATLRIIWTFICQTTPRWISALTSGKSRQPQPPFSRRIFRVQLLPRHMVLWRCLNELRSTTSRKAYSAGRMELHCRIAKVHLCKCGST